MKTLFTLIFLFIFYSTAVAGEGALFDVDGETVLTWNLTFAPPHNEPVVGDRVARYRLYLDPEWRGEYVRFATPITIWGVNTWQPSKVVGHGSEAWSNSDWSVEKVRVAITPRLEIGSQRLHFYTEYYMPLNRKSWGGHGLERHYYWLTGFGGSIR